MTGPLQQLGRLPRRHPRLAVLALALLAVGAAAGGAWLWSGQELHAARAAVERYDFADAQRHLDRCLLVRFRSAEVRLLAAQTARRRDAYREAERHLVASEELGGKTKATSLERLLLTAQRGDLDGLEEVLQARTSPESPEAALVLEALAKGYQNRCWQSEMLHCLNLLLERQPHQPVALLLRARVYDDQARAGRPERAHDALHDYEQVMEVAPSLAARLGLAGALFRVGRPWDALQHYERLYEERADHPDVLLGLARCRYRLHESAEAQRLLDALLERQPTHAAALLERGRLEFHAGRLDGAERWLGRAAAAARPCDGEALRTLAQCLAAQHKDDDARTCRDQLRKNELRMLQVDRLLLQANRDPRDVALRFQLAVDLLQLGRDRDGVGALYVILEQDPQHGPAHAALAEYFERAGQPDRAARHRRAVQRAGLDTPTR